MKKALEKTLMKLTIGVNFVNILRECFSILRKCFSYKSKFCNFSLITVQLCDFLAKGYWQKSANKMLMQLTTGGVGLHKVLKFCSIRFFPSQQFQVSVKTYKKTELETLQNYVTLKLQDCIHNNQQIFNLRHMNSFVIITKAKL